MGQASAFCQLISAHCRPLVSFHLHSLSKAWLCLSFWLANLDGPVSDVGTAWAGPVGRGWTGKMWVLGTSGQVLRWGMQVMGGVAVAIRDISGCLPTLT